MCPFSVTLLARTGSRQQARDWAVGREARHRRLTQDDRLVAERSNDLLDLSFQPRVGVLFCRGRNEEARAFVEARSGHGDDPNPDRVAHMRRPERTAGHGSPRVEEPRVAGDILANGEHLMLCGVPAHGDVQRPLDELSAGRRRHCSRETVGRSANRRGELTGTRIGVVAVGEACPIDDCLCILRPFGGLVERDWPSGRLLGRNGAEPCPRSRHSEREPNAGLGQHGPCCRRGLQSCEFVRRNSRHGRFRALSRTQRQFPGRRVPPQHSLSPC